MNNNREAKATHHNPEHEDFDVLGGFDEDRSQDEPRPRPRQRRWIIVVAMLVVVVLGLVALFTMRSSSSPGQEAAMRVAKQVRQAPDATSHRAKGQETDLVVTVSQEDNSFALSLDNPHPAPDGSEYQVYVMDQQNRLHPSILLGQDPGDTWFGVRGDVDTTREIHVAIVGEGGQETPPEKDVVSLTLPNGKKS